MEIAPDLVRRLKRLRLGGLLPTLPDRATHARQVKLAPLEFLELLLGRRAEECCRLDGARQDVEVLYFCGPPNSLTAQKLLEELGTWNTWPIFCRIHARKSDARLFVKNSDSGRWASVKPGLARASASCLSHFAHATSSTLDGKRFTNAVPPCLAQAHKYTSAARNGHRVA
jgi:hypothetical protein